MTELNAAIRNIPIPVRMNKLSINDKGFPIPWFVHIDENGIDDFRIIGRGKIMDAINWRKCWLCGQTLGTYLVFTIGPMCTVNRVSAEPPSHLSCAEYAVRACPFLNNPRMRRNEKDMPDHKDVGGYMLPHNPGATALWVARDYKPFQVSNGLLIQIGEPDRVLWYVEGREATRAEVEDSIDNGLPFLKQLAEQDGPEAIEELNQAIIKARKFMPPWKENKDDRNISG